MCGHSFEYIGNSNDPRLQKNRALFKAIRIARSIPSLMMLQDHVCDWPVKIDVLYNLMAHQGVFFNERELGLRKAGGLSQILGRNVYLSNIMY